MKKFACNEHRLCLLQASIRTTLRRVRHIAMIVLAVGVVFAGTTESPRAQSRDWPQFQKDSRRSGRTVAKVAPPCRVRWIWSGPGQVSRNRASETGWTDNLSSVDGYDFPIPDSVSFTIAKSIQAVSDDSLLYFGTLDGSAYAVALHDGSTAWSAALPSGTVSTAAVLGNSVIIASTRGVVHAFDRRTGVELWRFDTRSAVTSAPCVQGDCIVVANHRGDVLCFEENGTLRWSAVIGAPVVGGIAASDRIVYIPAENLSVYALDLATGNRRAAAFVSGQSFRLCHPVIHGRWLWVTSCPIVMPGSEYIMEEVMASSSTLDEEERNILQWLSGEDNNGNWRFASPDWRHIAALDTGTLEQRFTIPAGPVDGCGYPPPSVCVDNTGRILRWWKTRFPSLTTIGPVFGSSHTIDLAAVDSVTGRRRPIDNGRLSGMWPLETDNLYALSVGGNFIWMRQNFRGTQVLDLETSTHTLVQVTTRYNDGGNFSHANICYRNENLSDGGQSVPYRTSQQPLEGRVAPSIVDRYVVLVESFGIVVLEEDR